MIYLCMTMWKSRTIGLTSCITLVLPMVHCDCGTCLVPTDATRKLNREIRHVDNPLLHDQEWATRGARHGRSEDQRAYYEAEGCLKKAHKKRFESILHRCQTWDIYRSSQTNIGWTAEFCRRSDELAEESHSYVATGQERERYEKVWTTSLNSQGPTGPIRSGADFPAAFRKFREVKQDAAGAGHQFKPTVRPDLQIRQRQGQQFQQCKDPNTDHVVTEKSDQATSMAGQPVAWSVDPSTSWIWWQPSSS